MRKGAQTLVFESKPVILSHAAIGGKKEGEGPLAAYFDFLGKDAKLSQKTFEKAESKLQELALDTAKRKLGASYEDIDVLFAGDLLNQCISSSFAARRKAPETGSTCRARQTTRKCTGSEDLLQTKRQCPHSSRRASAWLCPARAPAACSRPFQTSSVPASRPSRENQNMPPAAPRFPFCRR